MTSKIATVANLAFQVFRACSLTKTTPPTGLNYHNCGNSDSYLDESEITQSELMKQLLADMASLKPNDIDLDAQSTNVILDQYAAPAIRIKIAANAIFDMDILCLRSGAHIPLHGHPGMFGLTTVMLGSMRSRSLTPLVTPQTTTSELLVAEPHSDDLLDANDYRTSFLTPKVGNIHEIIAVSGPVAFLNILAPPYENELGTLECPFYREVDSPKSDENPEETASPRVYLAAIEKPKDYWCESVPYRGPPVT